MAKRIFLFLATNILVLITLSIVLNVLGVKPYITAQGLHYESLMIFCLAWGMGGALISLAISRMMAKWMMKVRVIDANTSDPGAQRLVQKVHQLSRSAGLSVMPQVGFYESPEVNAFATGPTKSRSLVAVSTGLLERLSEDEVEGVLGHEVAHIANGDMVTMTLIQGVVNAFVMFLARIIAFAIDNAMRSRDGEGGGLGFFGYIITVFVLEAIFMVFGTMVVAWFSRYREFRADQGGARLAGREKMVAALEKLQRTMEIQDPRPQAKEQQAFSSLKISTRGGVMALLSTHPPLEQRIARLQSMGI